MIDKNENREHCKAIAERLEAVANGSFYRCPECGEWIEFKNDQYDGENATYTCQECNATYEENELESISFYDYFTDQIIDVEFRVGSDRKYRSVKIMVAWGGPNIYIDTAAGAVQLFWWTERAEYPVDPETITAIDEWAEEWYQC
jgi:predicted RNA-binding Zn-ribbon protein involved in translation (DUF1610 family)